MIFNINWIILNLKYQGTKKQKQKITQHQNLF